jgi:hypothetical protein
LEETLLTTALQDAFQKAAALPPDQQEALAAIVLAEIADEDRWQRSFARSQDALSKLAAEALDEDAAGRTLDLDESL